MDRAELSCTEVKLKLRSAKTNAVAVKLHVNLMLNIALK